MTRAAALGLAMAGVFGLLASAGTPAADQLRAQRLENSILAPCCYTEPVSKHQSEIALKMRLEIARWVAEGRTDRDILDTYERQYGHRVLVDPRTIPAWWTPWVPWILAIFGAALLFRILSRWSTKRVPADMIAPGTDPVELPDFDEPE